MPSNRQKGGNRIRRNSHKIERTLVSIDYESLEAWRQKLILHFKTARCTYDRNPCLHDVRCCPNNHSERDRRRPPILDGGGMRYAADPCKEQFDDLGRCSRGDECGFCHNTVELLYHPDIFHKRLCQGRSCPRGDYCAFAHSRDTLLIPHFDENEEAELTSHFMMYKFKTLWCPFGEPHNWESCVYAHTYRDWRRLPSLGYCSRPCPSWNHSLDQGSDLAYSERCRLGMACPCAHGAKEQLYHPDFYKTSPCDNPSCSKRVALCAFTHGLGDLRMKPASAVSQRRSAIAGAEEFLQANQPTYRDPPKYSSLEEATNFANNESVKSLYDMQVAALARTGSCMCTSYGINADMLSTRPMQAHEAALPASSSLVPQPFGSQCEMQGPGCYYAPVIVLQPIQIVFSGCSSSSVSTDTWGENDYGLLDANALSY